MAHLSPRQQKELDHKRAPIKHAMERLQERHFPDLDDDGAADIVEMMTSLCILRDKVGDRGTARLVNIETPVSHVVDLDMFDDGYLIRVCYDPVDKRIKTVFPKQ